MIGGPIQQMADADLYETERISVSSKKVHKAGKGFLKS